MRRIFALLALAALVIALLVLSGCQKKVEVRTGTTTICTYGEVVSEDVRTVTVPADEAGRYRVVTKTVTCDRHSKIESLYEAAQNDIAKGDLTAAKAKLTQVIALDPTFGKTQEQLTVIASGKKPSADPTPRGGATSGSKPATTTPKPGDEQPTGPVVSMLKWAPDTLTGFTAATPAADVFAFSRQYTPESGSNVVSLVIAAEQFRDSASAQSALRSQVKLPYSSNASQISINGRSCFYGNDNTRYATLGFTQGAVLVQIEMAAGPGEQATLKDPIMAVARQLP